MSRRKNKKCECLTKGIKIALWCFDESLDILKKYDDKVFYFHMDMISMTKIKLIELEKIIFVDLDLGNKRGKGFKLRDCRCVFKYLDAVMNNICKYSVPFSNVWKVMRIHPQWLYYVIS